MKILLLPLKLLVLPVMLMLTLASLLGKATTHISAYIIGLFLLVLIAIDFYCLWMHRWTDVGIVTAIIIAVLILQFGAMFFAEVAGEWSKSLKKFIFS